MIGRLVVAIIFMPILIAVMYKGGPLLLTFTTTVIGVSLYEFYKMVENKKEKVHKKSGIVIGLLIPIMYFFIKDANNYLSLLFVMMILYFIIMQVAKGKIKGAMTEISYTVFGILYISFLFSHILFIAELKNGNLWILTAQLMVWACDSAAYFFGIKFGKHRLAPKISPKKSIEGSVAGLLASIASIFLIKYLWFLKGAEVSLLNVIIIGLLVGTVGQIGDLVESLFKREFEIKDSGKILAGHGGMLDRFDSMIFVLPVLYYYLKYVVM